MKPVRRCRVIIFTTLLAGSVFAPIIFLSCRLHGLTLLGMAGRENSFVEDYHRIKHGRSSSILSAIFQEVREEIKEPQSVIYRDKDFSSTGSHTFTNGNVKSKDYTVKVLQNNSIKINDDYSSTKRNDPKGIHMSIEANQSKSTPARRGHDVKSRVGAADERVHHMKDQVIRARAYLQFTPPNGNSHLVKELKHNIREVERSVREATRDSQLPRSSQQKMRAMEATLSKANKIYPDCSAMDAKLRAMAYNTEEQIRTQRKQVSYLINLAARTTTRGFHCLSMQLTTDYFSIPSEERVLPNQHKFDDPDIHHIAIFSDNILACSVVVNSTVFSAAEPGKLAFHVVTDAVNLPAMWMWFRLNPPAEAAVHIETRPGPDHPSLDDLPRLFPAIDRLLLLGEHLVVQKDVGQLWTKVMAAAEGSAGGVIMLDLRRQNPDESSRGSSTEPLEAEWSGLGLGYDPWIEAAEIEKAYVLRFDGAVKPWLDPGGVRRHMAYWTRFVDYGNPHLKQCNIHE